MSGNSWFCSKKVFKNSHDQLCVNFKSIDQLTSRGFKKANQENTMLNWAITFLIIALIAALLGFGGIAGAATEIAKILFIVFLILFLVSLIFGWRRRGPPAV